MSLTKHVNMYGTLYTQQSMYATQFEIKGGERGGRGKGGSANGDDSSTVLSYTGYVDRGARIEARFSKRPLKVCIK
jgi:hypothetical protein